MNMLVFWQCEDGGTGRRTGFRIQRFIRGGSTPPPRTSNLVEALGKGKIVQGTDGEQKFPYLLDKNEIKVHIHF